MCHGLFLFIFILGATTMTCKNSSQSANNIWANQEKTQKGLKSLYFFALRPNIFGRRVTSFVGPFK